MKPFTYVRAGTVEEAREAGGTYLAGGTNLLDLLKENVLSADRLVDLTWMEAPRLKAIEAQGDGLWLGALVKNAATANHPLVRQGYPLLTQAILAGASPQIRNMATNGGNLLQRTRCPYFYEAGLPCNQRVPGSGCSALEGHHENHAIFGWTPECVATFPSDMATALVALEAAVHLGSRQVPVEDLVVAKGELIEGITLPASRFASHCYYLKVRERSSYAFALVSVAAALEIVSGTIQEARIVLGSVALKPWRCREAERFLVGKGPDAFQQAASLALQGARPLRDNAYKVELARRAVARALQRSAGV